MDTCASPYQLPPPEQVREQIVAAEEELRALRRLLRASLADAKATEARRCRKALEIPKQRGTDGH